MYLFDERGLAQPVHDNLGFAVIGTGFFTGGNLLLRLLGYEPGKSYMLDIGALSTFIIDVVSEIDPAVGAVCRRKLLHEGRRGKGAAGPLEGGGHKGIQGEGKNRGRNSSGAYGGYSTRLVNKKS